MNRIYRFPIDMEEAANNKARFSLSLPVGARILHVDVLQRAPHEPSIWILLDPERKDTVHRTFEIVGTGNPAEASPDRYVATFQQHGFVWHLFEVT